MDHEMIERCKAELERCFNPAVNFKAPYVKVMSDMAIKAVIKAMREPTEKMVLAVALDKDKQRYSDIYKIMIDEVIND